MSSATNPGDIAALILNGGKARRMNAQDKSQIVVEGQRIIDRQLKVLRPRFVHVALVGARQAEPGLTLLQDRVGGKGPLDGIAAGLAWSPEPWLLVLACDMPFVQGDVLDLLMRSPRSDMHIVGAVLDGRPQPLLALYHRSLLPVLDRCLAESSLRASALLAAPPAGVRVHRLAQADIRAVDSKYQSFQNFNTPEDLLHSEASIE